MISARKMGLLLAALVLNGCASPITLKAHFEPRDVAWFYARGTNTLEGSAIARAYNGSAKTCAALPVTLFPVSPYAKERMLALYGSVEEGFNPALMGRPANFENDDPAYLKTAKTTRCDARGRFAFSELPDGDYFLVSEVTWHDRRAGLPQGGYLMRRLQVSTGETKEVLLAH
jgi:hypothetical protein